MNRTRREVLEAIANGPRSGSGLADDLGVSRAAVWKHVEALREEGFEIGSGPEGYDLESVPEYGGYAVAHGLDAPFEIQYERETGSTNQVARDAATEGASDLVVLADEQTGGRGRLDREWAAPSGGIWLSIVLRPDRPPSEVPLFTLAAAVAVTRAAREAGVDAGIKWPNDVLVDVGAGASEGPDDADGASDETPRDVASSGGSAGERKLAGILTEMEGEADRVSWVVVGIGINANVDADALPDGATTIREQVGDVDRRRFTQRVLETFHELRSDPDAILPAWRERTRTLGREVRVETPDGEVVGTAVDVERPGALVVETESGTVRVHAGDCEHLRPAPDAD